MPSARTPALLMRGYYFLMFGGLGALFPYLPPFLRDRGLSPVEIAQVMVIAPIGMLVAPPLWGLAADAFGARSRALRIASLGTGLTTVLFATVDRPLTAMAAMALFSIFRSALMPLADAVTHAVLDGHGARFGSIRVWGSAGFATFVSAMGLLHATARPWPWILSAAAIYLSSAAMILALHEQAEDGAGGPAAAPARSPRALLRAVTVIAAPLELAAFLGGVVLYYAAHSTYDVYIGLHLRDLGYGDAFLGPAWSLGVLVEIGVMGSATRIFRRATPAALLPICALVAAVRWWTLATSSGVVALLASQSLHGVTFGLWYLSMVKFAQDRSPPALRASVQGLALAAMGLGQVVGYFGGGVVFDRGQGPLLYRCASLCALASGSAYLVPLIAQRRARSRSGA